MRSTRGVSKSAASMYRLRMLIGLRRPADGLSLRCEQRLGLVDLTCIWQILIMKKLLLCLLCVLRVSVGMAEAQTGSITGRVVDPLGAESRFWDWAGGTGRSRSR